MKTLVIMPTYNEAMNLEHSVAELFKHNAQVSLLIVDDASPDGTGDLAEKLAASDSRVKVLHRSEKNGLGPAYLAGFQWGFQHNYDFLVEMEADGSHRPQDRPALLALAESHDLVIGSRWVPGGAIKNWPASRQLISRIGNGYARFMLRSGIKDITAGFRVYRASFLQQLDLEHIASHGYSFQVEMAYRSRKAGGRIVEVPITFVEREHGVSKMSNAIVLEAMWLVTKLGLSRFFGKHKPL